MRIGVRRAAMSVLVFALGATALPGEGKVFLSQEEALKLAFPAGVTVERRTSFLTAAEQEQVRAASGVAAPGALVVSYVGTKDGVEVGAAFFDTHVVRTETETLMVLVDAAGRIARIEVLSFSEPEEYLPRGAWYAQFTGKGLDENLSAKRGIRPVSGATLTARATIEAARRVLALYQLLHRPAPTPRPTAAAKAVP